MDAPRLLPPLSAIPREIAEVADYEGWSRERLTDPAWAYLVGGAGDELTVADNRRAFDDWALRPRVLAKVADGHTRISLLGQTLEHPLLLAPVAYQRLFHPQGELATAWGASAMATPLVVSALATLPLADIVAATTAPVWLQLYWQGDRGAALEMVRLAEACGCAALVLTVDAPLAGIRLREHRAGFALPPGLSPANLPTLGQGPAPLNPGESPVFQGAMARAPGWDDLAYLVQSTSLPVVVKGILDPRDGVLARQAGARAVVVSNHGGRTLDTLPATLEVLPEVVEALAGSLPVLLDGGIRRGGDVFKALAFGATAVLIGRGYVHALATAGALGVAHVLRTLREELEVTMALMGCASLAQVRPDCLRPRCLRPRRR